MLLSIVKVQAVKQEPMVVLFFNLMLVVVDYVVTQINSPSFLTTVEVQIEFPLELIRVNPSYPALIPGTMALIVATFPGIIVGDMECITG